LRSTFLNKADKWITKILTNQGVDEENIVQKKIYWIASVSVTSMILLLTITYHIIFPQLRILIYYGFFLFLIFLQGVIYPLLSRRFRGGDRLWFLFLNQTLVALTTFYCILKLGGIPYSGGLIFVGLALVFFSLNFKKRGHSIGIFIIYILTVILAGILHPWLSIPPEMTPAVNVSLFVINLLWISGFAMVFVINFISQRVKLEQLESNRLKELVESKTKLYTSIAHEFRTPLTIIMGMNDLMLNDPDKWLAEGNGKIDSNAKILLRLVNQMLDLSRIKAGAMTIRMVRGDIVHYIKYIVELFRSFAEQKKIELNFIPCDQDMILDYDTEKIMQIISNLLTNALKFTQNNGKVIVEIAGIDQTKYKICVSDNGPGIPEDHLQFIFDRFYRVNENSPGSGLGLALTMELVKLMNGTITVESIYGEGTEFTVELPATFHAPMQEFPGFNELKNRITENLPPLTAMDSLSIFNNSIHNTKPMLLVVEDNGDVVRYMVTFLEKEYNILIAANGEEGINKAIEFIPDIILSDIMMPVLDGIEMLKIVKSDFRTSHVPVVLLTAKADIASRIEGIEKGADAYLAKPFIKEELLVQLRSLISLRKKLQERYASVGHLSLNSEKDFQLEDTFIKRCREIMTSNLSDDTFDIQSLCNGMAMSRTQFYRKFRSLTNKTPNDYLRTLRLHKAKDLLTGSDTTVTKAAYSTGFKNLSHFSKVFSEEFGVNPSEINI
jgi:signal transduction histidine kinase/AraC-like DNA-binding protein